MKMHRRKSIYQGFLWTFADNVFLKCFTFIVHIVLARMLTPNDFGLIGIVSIFMILGNTISEGGMGNSIIRDLDANEEDYNAVFVGNLMIACSVYLTLYFTAPLVASLFNKTLITKLLRIYSLSIIITAFFSIHLNVLMKEMRFQHITLLNLPAVLIGSISGLLLAYNGNGVWSLVFMQLIIVSIKAILYWWNSFWIPSYNISKSKLQKHFNFGYKLMLSSILNVSMREIYSFLIGKKFTLSTLGFYNQARTLQSYPTNIINIVINNVTYPMLSQLQKDKTALAKQYRLLIKSVFFIVVPLMFALGVVAKPLFLLLLTEKWLPAVPYFQLLILSGVLYPVHALNINIFKIYNRTDLFLKLEIIKVVLTLISLFIGFIWGIYGLLFSMVTISYLAILINTYHSKSLINYSTLDQLKDMSAIFFIGCFAAIISSFVLFRMEYLSPYISLLISALSFFIIYLTIFLVLKNRVFTEIVNWLQFVIKK